jgi:hypothetical protein
MRWWATPLALLILMPGVHSATTGLYVEEHNITYTLGSDSVLVEEVITFGNSGDPFTFADDIYLQRGDASDILVQGARSTVVENYPDGGNTIKFYLILSKGNRRTITITYKRSDLLSRDGVLRRFNGYALGRSHWLVHKSNIRFITPENHYFGPITPQTEKIREGNRETVIYSLDILQNLSQLREGVLVDLRYGNYRDMAIQEIASAKDLLEEAHFDLENANKTLENAGRYGNVSEIQQLYDEALGLLEAAGVELDIAQINMDPLYSNYYDAYTHGTRASNMAKNVSKKAKQVDSRANYFVQKVLEDRVSEMNQELSAQSTLLKKGLNQTTITTLQPQVESRETNRDPLYLAVALVLVVGALIALSKIRIKTSAPLKKSTVADYRDIDNLKRKTFDGFEKKVDTVKKGVEIATKIRSLRSDKEKVLLGIENLRKKRVSGEIAEEVFRQEKAKMEARMDELDSEIIALEEELEELKQVRR